MSKSTKFPVVEGQWLSLNDLVGIGIGAEIKGQLISGGSINVAVSDSIPTDESNGFKFKVGDFFLVESGASAAWIIASESQINSTNIVVEI